MALAYSHRVVGGVVGMVDGIRRIAENECNANIGAKTHLPRGFIRDTLVVGCLAGGMISQLPQAIASLPSRMKGVWSRWTSGTAEGRGEALASIPFFLIEGASYGQMASGAVATFKGGVSGPVLIGSPSIGGFEGMSGGVGVAQASWTPALATAGAICVASGEMATGVAAASSSDDFGGPIGISEPVLRTQGADPDPDTPLSNDRLYSSDQSLQTDIDVLYAALDEFRKGNRTFAGVFATYALRLLRQQFVKLLATDPGGISSIASALDALKNTAVRMIQDLERLPQSERPPNFYFALHQLEQLESLARMKEGEIAPLE